MKALHTSLSLFLLTSQLPASRAEEDRNLAGCSVELNSYFYNLQKLSKDENEKDYMVKFNDGEEDLTIAFNVCDFAKREPSDGKRDFANLLSGGTIQGDYKHLTSDSIEDVEVELLDPKRPDIGLRLKYLNSGFRCTAVKEYSFTVETLCDEDATESIATFKGTSLADKCSPAVELISPFACPTFSLHSLWNFFEKYAMGFACVFIVLGTFLMLFGGRYYKATMFISAMISVSGFLMVLLFAAIMPAGTPEWSVWVCFMVSLGIGTGFGFAAKKWSRVGVLFVGAVMGAFIGMAVFNSVVFKISQDNTLLGLWLTIMFSAMVVAGICMVFFDNAIIFGSSIVGSYLLFRGISVFAGGYPNEFLIYQDYQNSKLQQMPVSFMIYLAVMTLTAVVALVYQSRNRVGNEEAYNYRQYDFKYRRV